MFRPQTYFLLGIIVVLVIAMFIPVWEKENTKTKEKAVITYQSMTYTKNKKEKSSQSTIYLTIVAGVICGLVLVSVKSWQNRLRQMQFGLLISLLLAVLLGLNVYLVFQGNKLFAEPKYGTYLINFYFPAIAMIFNLISNRLIRRDEKMVRESYDRLR